MTAIQQYNKIPAQKANGSNMLKEPKASAIRAGIKRPGTPTALSIIKRTKDVEDGTPIISCPKVAV